MLTHRIAMFNRIIKICTLLCLAPVNGCKESRSQGNNMLTEDQIVEIANKTVIEAGHSFDVLKVELDVGNRAWQEALAYLRESDPDFARRYDILENRSYQAVHYIPDTNKALFMGEIYIFVDKQTGEVITSCSGL